MIKIQALTAPIFYVICILGTVTNVQAERKTSHAAAPLAAGHLTAAALKEAVKAFRDSHKEMAAAVVTYEKQQKELKADGFIELSTKKRLSKEDATRYLNSIFLVLSEMRLKEEIAALEARLKKPFPKEWMKPAEEARLNVKREALEKVLLRQSELFQGGGTLPIILDTVQLEERLHLLKVKNLPSGLGTEHKREIKKIQQATADMRELTQALTENPDWVLDEIEDISKILEGFKEATDVAREIPPYKESIELLAAKADLMALHWSHSRQAPFLSRVDKIRADDVPRSKEVSKFISAVGGKASGPDAPTDLSFMFHKPVSQKKLLSCTIHALVSDMGTYLPEGPSANFAYTLSTWGDLLLRQDFSEEALESTDENNKLLNGIKKISAPENFPDNMRDLWKRLAEKEGVPGYVLANRGIRFDLARELARKNGLPSESEYPSDKNDFLPKSLQAVKGRKYILKDVEEVAHSLTSAEIKKLIKNGQPFQMVIASDARNVEEDWIRVDPFEGSIPHVFNVAGYEEGYDPFDNRHKPYLILRDSFTDGKFHYKASLESLVPVNAWAMRVKSVGTLEKPVTYKRFEE